METIKTIGMIIGIFLLLALGVKLLLHSDEKARAKKLALQRQNKQIDDLHKQLDETLELLESQNDSLEKISDFSKKINERVFKS